MKTRTGLLLTHAIVLPLFVSAAFAQVTELGPADQPLYQPSQSGQNESHQVFAQQELHQILAPIALYPDSLLSQILMASTYPIEVVQAARWSRANPGLSGDAAVRAVEQQSWDPSVKSLVAFPQVISMMDEKLDWMERLGDAFLSQQQQVMDAVQELRQKAQAAGNLQSNEIVRVEPQGQTIIIEQANPRVVYVPYYDPTIIYGPWWYPAHPPVYWAPWPGYYARPGFSTGFFWGTGISIGSGFYFGAFDWPHRYVNVVNVNNFYYQPPAVAPYGVQSDGWYHDPAHRRGVPYRDPVLRQEFARPFPVGRPDARRDFRGIEPSRVQSPDRRTAGQESSENYRADQRANWRDRIGPRRDKDGRPDNARPDNNGRPGGPNRDRSDTRIAPAQPNVGNAPGRPNATDAGRAESRSVPMQPNANVTPNALPSAPLARPAPMQARPNVEQRPRIFEGVGQGPASRGRDRDSVQRAAPPARPVAQPRFLPPAARPEVASAPRPQAAPPGQQKRFPGGGDDQGHKNQQR